VGTPTPGALLKAEALPDAGGKSGKSARITDEDDKAGISILQNVPAEAGKAYTLTFMSKTTVPEGQKGTPGYAMIQFLDTKGAWLNNPDAPTATGTPTPEERKLIKRDVCNFAAPGKDWQAATLSATAPAGTTKMWIVFKAGNGGRGVVDVSDVMLAPATP
jgi:type II secretory pathway pseudopilin PulG